MEINSLNKVGILNLKRFSIVVAFFLIDVIM